MEVRALMAVLRPQRARLLGRLRRRVGNATDAEDILQGALARAAESAPRLRDPTRVLPWFDRILRNLVADHARARRTDLLGRASSEALDELEPESASGSSACPCAGQLLEKLRPTYATVLRRIDVESESPDAVAQDLGISLGNLQVRVHRARRQLRSRVREHCGVSTMGACLDCTCTVHDRCGSGAGNSSDSFPS